MDENREGLRKYKTFLREEDWAGFIDYYHGYSQNVDGDYGYYHNPNAKWDWYVMGGRWCGYFTMKGGKGGVLGEPSYGDETIYAEMNQADQAFKGDIDFDAMRAKGKAKAKMYWSEWVFKKNDDDPPHPYLEYGIRQDDTKETYIARQTSISTFAVVKDGKWYEKGSMGWWACVSDEKDADVWQEEFDKLVMSLPDDTLLTLVDCHI